jgi:hypothetical protein
MNFFYFLILPLNEKIAFQKLLIEILAEESKKTSKKMRSVLLSG